MTDEQPLNEDANLDSEMNVSELSKVPKKIKIGQSHWIRFKAWYKTDKKKSAPLTILALILLLVAIPWTRYYLVGLALKKDFYVQVTDSKTGSPVSGATVSIGSISAETDGTGKARLRAVNVGQHTLSIVKKYYQNRSLSSVIPILSQRNTPEIRLVATGRQVKIHIVNLINQKVLADASIKLADISAKTDAGGNAIVVLPAGTSSKQASLSLEGYNDAKVIVTVSDKEIKKNNYTLTPTGKLYFLSKLSGTIDVVKTNLDGSNRQTLYAGTGKEEDSGTVLLASRDWKYLALLSRHDSDQPQLYLIETASDKVSVIDQGNSTFSLVGWSNDSFVYRVTRNSYSDWQPKKYVLKSFNADSKRLNILDQTDGVGDAGQYAQEQLGNVYVTSDGTIVYYKTWYKSYSVSPPNNLTDGKHNGIYSIRADGSGKKTLKNLDASGTGSYNNYIDDQTGKPDEVYFSASDSSGTASYLEYKNGSLQSISADQYPTSGIYNTYLLSPSGNKTFWSEERDGKNTMFIGAGDGTGGKTIAALSDYQTYGWYSDNYLLTSKNSSELYILPVGGLAGGQQPIKITDYHKPAQNYYGYGGGYGGI